MSGNDGFHHHSFNCEIYGIQNYKQHVNVNYPLSENKKILTTMINHSALGTPYSQSHPFGNPL